MTFIKGIDHEVYVGKDPNHGFPVSEYFPSGHQQQQKASENSSRGLVHYFTSVGSGRVKINTLPAPILAVLPGMDEASANRIEAYRVGPDGVAGTDDDIYLQTVEDLNEIPGLSHNQVDFLSECACFSSNYFRVFSYAKLKSGVDCALMATVLREGEKCKVLYVERIY
jgi:hypothetical protein